MSTATSISLARLWLSMKRLQDEINGETLPLLAHLQADDEALTAALEAAVEAIENHQRTRRLVAVASEVI